MEYKIEKKDAFRIVGVKEHLDMNIEESMTRVPLFWQETARAGIIPKLTKIANIS